MYTDDAGIVSKSAEGFANMIAVIGTAFKPAGLTVTENKTETILLRTPNQPPQASSLVIEATG